MSRRPAAGWAQATPGRRASSISAPKTTIVAPDARWQFERLGYFVADRADHGVGGKVVFNRVTGLKDSWGK